MADEHFDRMQAALADRYAVQRELGSGGMATVYLAEDVRHERLVALKVLKPELAHALGPERFIREIKITARLTHPHILPLLDSGEAGGFLFYVMPFIEGESLRDRLDREKQLPVEDAAQIAREVADALSYAHSQDVIHRDMKPENILLEAGHAVVADFGIARAISAAGGEQLTETGVTIGTPAYMSPEQAGGSSDLDGRSDLYSLGCVFFEMLAGRPPFTGPTVSIVQQHLAAEAPPITSIRPAVPAPIAAALARSLAKTPADRFNPVAQFAEAIAPTVTAAAGTVATRPGMGRGLLYAALVVLAVVGAIAVILMPFGTPRTESNLVEDRVVVAALDNETGDPTLDPLGAMAADWIAQGLLETQLVDVIPATTAREAWRYVRSEIDAGRVSDPVTALAVETGAGIVVSGAIYRIGDSIRLQVEATDVSRGSPLGALDPVVGQASVPEQAIATLRERVMGLLAIRLDPRVGETASPRQPPVFAAYREWNEGFDLFYDFRYDDALVRFRRAHELDPTFWLPVLSSFNAYGNRGLWAPADSVAQLLETNREHLSLFHQYRLDGYRGLVDGDLDAALLAFRRQAELAVGASEVWNNVAVAAVWNNRPREAVAVLEGQDPERGFFRGWQLYWGYLTQAYHMLGEHETELAAARRGRLQYPDHPAVFFYELRALAALERTDEAGILVDSILLTPRLQGMAGQAGRELRAHGLDDLAHLALGSDLEFRRSAAAEVDATRDARASWAYSLLSNERWEEAREIYAQLSSDFPSSAYYRGAVGALAALAGDRDLAVSISDELSALTQPYLRGRNTFLQAGIAALLGDRDEAVRLLRQAFDEGEYRATNFRDKLHLDMAFEQLRDYPPFRELMRPAG